MANKTANTLSAVQRKAIGKCCSLCGSYLTQEEVSESDFIYSKTKRGDLFIHKHCYEEEYGQRGL